MVSSKQQKEIDKTLIMNQLGLRPRIFPKSNLKPIRYEADGAYKPDGTKFLKIAKCEDCQQRCYVKMTQTGSHLCSDCKDKRERNARVSKKRHEKYLRVRAKLRERNPNWPRAPPKP